MYENVFLPVVTLQKTNPANPGFCKLRYCKHEDVASFPRFDPITGLLESALELKPGGVLYTFTSPGKSSFSELFKASNPGGFYDVGVNLSAIGFNASNTLTLNTMRYHDWVILVSDRSGEVRLIGNKDKGAKFFNDYESGETGTSNFRKGPMRFAWQSVNKCPIYDGQTFDIIIGGQVITAGALTLIMRFEVGAVGAPMVNDDHLLANAAFANKNLLVIASGYALPCDDETGDIDWANPPASMIRHYHKTFAGNTIDFIGNVKDQEIIEIYAFS